MVTLAAHKFSNQGSLDLNLESRNSGCESKVKTTGTQLKDYQAWFQVNKEGPPWP